MKKLLKTLVFSAGIIGAYTALTTAKQRKEHYSAAKNYVTGITDASKELIQSGADTKKALNQLTQVALPLTQETVSEVQTSVKRFMQSNQPRIRRIKEKLATLQADIQTATKKQR